MASIYSLCHVGPYLYGSMDDQTSYLQAFLRLCFPVAFAKYVCTEEETHVLLVMYLDTLIVVSLFCSCYALLKLYECLTDRKHFYANVSMKGRIKETFGNLGFLNLLFPYNGLFDDKSSQKKPFLKNV